MDRPSLRGPSSFPGMLAFSVNAHSVRGVLSLCLHLILLVFLKNNCNCWKIVNQNPKKEKKEKIICCSNQYGCCGECGVVCHCWFLTGRYSTVYLQNGTGEQQNEFFAHICQKFLLYHRTRARCELQRGRVLRPFTDALTSPYDTYCETCDSTCDTDSTCDSTCYSTCPYTCQDTCPNTCHEPCPSTCSTCTPPTCHDTCGDYKETIQPSCPA